MPIQPRDSAILNTSGQVHQAVSLPPLREELVEPLLRGLHARLVNKPD